MHRCGVLTLVVGPSCSDHCTLKGLAIKLIVCLQAAVVSCAVFFGTFAKLRKTTISFVMSAHLSVCPSVRMEQLGSHWTKFHEI
jgi:hypothetical protein